MTHGNHKNKGKGNRKSSNESVWLPRIDRDKMLQLTGPLKYQDFGQVGLKTAFTRPNH